MRQRTAGFGRSGTPVRIVTGISSTEYSRFPRYQPPPCCAVRIFPTRKPALAIPTPCTPPLTVCPPPPQTARSHAPLCSLVAGSDSLMLTCFFAIWATATAEHTNSSSGASFIWRFLLKEGESENLTGEKDFGNRKTRGRGRPRHK